MIETMTRSTAATRYAEALDEIDQLEQLLVASPKHITLDDLKELGKLHRQAGHSRAEIFRIWNREEPIVKKKSLWKHIFLK